MILHLRSTHHNTGKDASSDSSTSAQSVSTLVDRTLDALDGLLRQTGLVCRPEPDCCNGTQKEQLKVCLCLFLCLCRTLQLQHL